METNDMDLEFSARTHNPDPATTPGRQEPSTELDYLLSRIDPVPLSETDRAVFFSTRGRPHYRFVYTFFAHALTERGYATLFFYDDEGISDVFEDLSLDGVPVTNCLDEKNLVLSHYRDAPAPSMDCYANFEEKRVWIDEYPDINLFPAFETTIRKINRRYQIDYRQEGNMKLLKEFYLTANLILGYCDRLDDYAGQTGKDITIVAWDTSYPPSNLFHLYCKSDRGENGLEYVELGTQYDSYFKADFTEFGKSLGASNFTRRNCDISFHGFEREFSEFIRDVRENPEEFQSIREEIEADLHGNILPGLLSDDQLSEQEERRELFRSIDTARSEGRDVFALFGHVFYDPGLYDTSPVFEDMCDWIDTTLSLFQNRDDLLLLKPHPGEINKPDPSLEPTQTLSSFVEGKIELADNIRLLSPHLIKAAELYQHITAGLVWTSSVGMEMTYLGVPCFVGGDAYYRPYLDLDYVESLADYREQLDTASDHTVPESRKMNVILLLYFLKTVFHRPFPYIEGIDYVGTDSMKIQWDTDEVDRYLKVGNTDLQEMLLRELNRPG